jgi:hypothetical protein
MAAFVKANFGMEGEEMETQVFPTVLINTKFIDANLPTGPKNRRSWLKSRIRNSEHLHIQSTESGSICVENSKMKLELHKTDIH